MKVGDTKKGRSAAKLEWLRSGAITPHCIIKREIECMADEQALQCQTKADVWLETQKQNKKKYKKYKREWAKLKNKEKVEQKEDKLTKRTYVGALCEWYRV